MITGGHGRLLAMTKVQLHYPLTRKVEDSDLEAFTRVHGFYGIQRVTLAPALDAVTVEYDASRLEEKDAEAALIRAGIPIQRLP